MMTPRAFAAILVRVLGVWLSIEALFRVGELLVWASSARRAPDATGWTSYPPIETTVGISELYLHDTYYFISHAAVSFGPQVSNFFSALFSFSRRIVLHDSCVVALSSDYMNASLTTAERLTRALQRTAPHVTAPAPVRNSAFRKQPTG